jgi:hypothetical protein
MSVVSGQKQKFLNFDVWCLTWFVYLILFTYLPKKVMGNRFSPITHNKLASLAGN